MVDINQFCRLLRVERSPFVERLFSMFDTDRGGLVDLKEFIIGARCCSAQCEASLSAHHAGLANVSGDVREDKVRFAFELFDLDSSGFIEANELRKIVRATNLASEKQLDRKVRWLLSQCDCNGDGQIRCGAAAGLNVRASALTLLLTATMSFRTWRASFPTLSSQPSRWRPA
jgi:serine/threonine-protein phosphatase 2B regulatory subunit